MKNKSVRPGSCKKEKISYFIQLLGMRCGAEGETRTPTNMRPLVPETSASTNSATSAFQLNKSES